MDREQLKLRLHEEIERADRALDELKAEARAKQAEGTFRKEELKADLEHRRAQAAAQLDKLKTGSALAWDDIKHGVSQAYDDLRTSLKRF